MLNRTKAFPLLLLLPLTAFAQPRETGYERLSYTLGEARVVARDPDGAGEANGVSVGGSMLLRPQVFVAGSVTSVGSGDFNDDTVELGVGLRHPLTSQVDLVGVAGVIHDDRQIGNRNLGSDLGPSLSGGVRASVTSQVEVSAFTRYTRLYGDSDLGLRGEGLYHFNRNFSVLAGVGLSNNERTADLGARWYFNPGN